MNQRKSHQYRYRKLCGYKEKRKYNNMGQDKGKQKR